MKTYTIIAGVNGAGKSSLTGVLRQEMNDLGVIVDVDKLAAANNGNNILAGRLAIQRIRSCLKKACASRRKPRFPVLSPPIPRGGRGKTAMPCGCTMSVLTLPKNRLRVLQTVSARAGITFPRRTCAAVLQAVSNRWPPSCLTVMKQPFSIMITALLPSPNTVTA